MATQLCQGEPDEPCRAHPTGDAGQSVPYSRQLYEKRCRNSGFRLHRLERLIPSAGFPKRLVNILENPSIIKTGVGIQGISTDVFRQVITYTPLQQMP